MKTESSLETLLKSNGLKSTRQRQMIMEILQSAESPLSAEMILDKMKETFTSCNLSTIYRNMEILVSKEVAQEISVNQKSFYALNVTQHGHYIQCTQCKEITRVEGCPFDTYGKVLEQKTGFKLIKHKVELFGICKKCSNKC